jgi:hypothetical protein
VFSWGTVGSAFGEGGQDAEKKKKKKGKGFDGDGLQGLVQAPVRREGA